MSLALVTNEVSTVLSSIRPAHVSEAVTHIFFPNSLVYSSINPSVNSLTVYFIENEVSLVGALVGEDEFTFAVLEPVDVVASIAGTIFPDLSPVTFLAVSIETTFVDGDFLAVFSELDESSDAVALPIRPLTLVYTSIRVDEDAEWTWLVVRPLADILHLTLLVPLLDS